MPPPHVVVHHQEGYAGIIRHLGEVSDVLLKLLDHHGSKAGFRRSPDHTGGIRFRGVQPNPEQNAAGQPFKRPEGVIEGRAHQGHPGRRRP